MLCGAKKLSSGCGIFGRYSQFVIASAAKQSTAPRNGKMDCFVPALLAMTGKLRSSASCCETKFHSAEQEFVARDWMTPGLGCITHFRYIRDLERQPAHDLAFALHEVETRIGKFQFGRTIVVRANRSPDDPAPMLGEIVRLWALHLDADQRLRHVLADRFLPVRSGRRIGAENIVAA